LSHPLYLVDVFAERRYAGNQLAVVLDAADLASGEMQQIAREMNYSETTFVTSAEQPNGGYQVRIFTPAQELPFAGHPTLGTGWVIRHCVAEDNPSLVRLNLGVGQVPVTFEVSPDGRELAWLSAPPVEFGSTCPPEQIAPALNLSPEDIDDKAPVQQLSAGVSIVFVPLRKLSALRRSRLDLAAFAPLAGEGFPPIVYLFCAKPRHPENDLCARLFFDAHGVREDPATGSATACLGAYLLKHRYFPEPELSLRIEQGYEIQRPSLLMLRAKDTSSSPEISVGGRVIPSAQGKLL
jgi:trans-2,3-dihydro-3-hydroxyanthranilate isomerase